MVDNADHPPPSGVVDPIFERVSYLERVEIQNLIKTK
jgi:hypothetical protein